MFFPSIEKVHVIRGEETVSLEYAPQGFLLIFALEDGSSLRAGEFGASLQKHDVYLFPHSVHPVFNFANKRGNPNILMSFCINDNAFRWTVEQLGPKLHADSMVVRSCLLNILNSCALQPDYFADSINYSIISLLYHSYVGVQNRKVRAGPISDGIIIAPTPNETLKRILNYIEEHISSEKLIDELSETSMQSPKQIGELFKYEYGCTVLQFINRFRLFKAKELMCYTNYSITEISSMTGFRSIHYFSRYFKAKEKVSPIEYKHAIIRKRVPSVAKNHKSIEFNM